jgi:hypothetical protein
MPLSDIPTVASEYPTVRLVSDWFSPKILEIEGELARGSHSNHPD